MANHDLNEVFPCVKAATLLDISVDVPQKSRGRMHKVPPHLYRVRDEAKIRQVHHPTVLSIGPYHYDESRFHETQCFKEDVLNKFIRKTVATDSTKDKHFFYNQIFDNINEIRDTYVGVDKYTDKELSEIILRDACFVASYVENAHEIFDWARNSLSMSISIFMGGDLLKLENQIPWRVVQHFLDLGGNGKGNSLFYDHLRTHVPSFHDGIKLPWEPEHEPLHLLEAYHRTLLRREAHATKKEPPINGTNPDDLLQRLNFPSRPVSYLRGKGILFRPSSFSLRDVRFTSRPCYGTLRLPTLYVDSNFKVLFTNMVMFEMCARDQSDFDVISYINFMKSLIGTPKDVKDLQNKKILYCSLGNDEEIVKAFKEIDTYGHNDFGTFADEKTRIDQHCDNKAKTLLSEFVNHYLRRPWTATGLFVAIFVFCFTFLQTYFTIKQRN